MSKEKVIIAHCAANAEIVAEIANQLQYSQFDFESIACNHSEGGLKDALATTADKVILVLSDNFLKSLDCMTGGLAYLQRLINSGRTLPLIMDGKYPSEDGNGFVAVPTKFERVSSVIKYMNYWQDEYLEMRKQKRFVPSDQEEAFSHKLRAVRAVSSEVGEFLRFLRDSYTCDYDTLSANNFQVFFQKFGDQPSHKDFVEGVTSNPVSSLLGTGMAAGAAALGATAIAKKVETPSAPSNGHNALEPATTSIATSVVSQPVVVETVAPVSKVEEIAQNGLIAGKNGAVGVETAEVAVKEEVLDNIVDEILLEQSQEKIGAVADTELLAQELAQKLPDSGVASPSTEEFIEEELVDVETALEDLSKQNIETLNRQQTAKEEAIMQNGLEQLEASQEIIGASPKLISESDLLRQSHELVQQGRLRVGLILLQEQLALRPEMVAARYQYAVFLAQYENNYQEASGQLQQIIEIDNNNLPANFFLGELAEAQGDFLVARQYYETVKAINPKFPNLHYKLGLLLARRYKDQATAATQHLHEAYAQNPRNIDALYNWGLVQNESLDNPKAAMSAFMKVAADVPRHPFVQYDIALAHYKLDDRVKAYQYYEKACAINPELRTPENDLAFAIPETEVITSSVEEEIETLNGTAISMNATAAENPDYVLELPSSNIEKTIPLQDLIEEEVVDIVIDEQDIDEEKLEAEFDATIGALGAAGLGIAAGAAIDSPSNIVEEEIVSIKTSEPPVEEKIEVQPIQQAVTKVDKQPTNVVLITGATSGIGKATAALFAERGHDLVLTGRRFSRLFKLKEEFEKLYDANIQLLPFDVRSAAAVKTAIDDLPVDWKNIDILINNAGLALGFDPIHEGSLEDWETMIDTNIKGLLYMTRAIAPFMVNRKQGHIINISSIAGKEVYPNGNVYCATKHAVEALTKAMRIDLHKYNIRVSQIAPGHVEETEFAQVRFHGDKERAKIYEDFMPVNSRDIAETIYFVATRPPHVNIQDILVMGTQQASAIITDRSGR